MKKFIKILGIIVAVLAMIAVCVYCFVLQYPKLKENPKVGKWYRIQTSEMKSSEGGAYHAFIKKGTENKVMVYFAGGGVSINEQTARNDTYNTKLVQPDILANTTMNMGGLAVESEDNPWKDWTVILFPYATGDFHCGTGEFTYTDKDGKEKILYHNGYINFTSAMDDALKYAGISEADSIIVTGYSAGGWGASILANDIFTNYFPNAANKTVLVDGSVALYDDWKDVAVNVWKAPKHITDRITSNNITLDSLVALHEDFGDDVTILFDSSVRDGDLSKVQRYLKEGVIDEETGDMPLEEKDADEFQVILKDFVYQLKERANGTIFIYDGLPWYDDPRNFTMHTLIATPYVYAELNSTDMSIAKWLNDAVDGKTTDYGLELLDKQYEYTE